MAQSALRNISPTWWKDIKPQAPQKPVGQQMSDVLGGMALATAPIPVVGDVAGAVSDAAMYAAYPEERTMLNAGMSLAGLLPFVPGAGGVRAAEKAADALQKTASAPRNTNWLHGTDSDFQKFDMAFAGKNFNDPSSKEGVFLSAQRGNAQKYGDNIMEVRDSFKNPKIINAEQDLKDEYLYLKRRGEVSGSFDDFISDFLEGDPYGYYETGKLYDDIKSAKSAGHDALIVDFGKLKMDRGGQFAVAFDPSTLKITSASSLEGGAGGVRAAEKAADALDMSQASKYVAYKMPTGVYSVTGDNAVYTVKPSGNEFTIQYNPEWKSKVKPFQVQGGSIDEVVLLADQRLDRSYNTQKSSAKYQSIPEAWTGEAKKIAKKVIDAGYDPTFSASTQSRSKYMEINGQKIRLSDHDLPLNYDAPDIDFRYGSDINALLSRFQPK